MPLQPVVTTPRRRLDSLDLLRGTAILGILLMNTQSMGLPSSAYYNPAEYGDYTGWNRIVWMIIHLLADMKFISTFSILFGAGILLQGQSAEAKGLSPAGVHYRRMIVLLMVGIAHAYGLWYGDVLVPYAMCGMILFPIRKLPAGLLVMFGAILIATATFMRFAIDHRLFAAAAYLGDWTNALLYGQVQRTTNAFELLAYRGGWWDQMQSRAYISFDNDGPSFLSWTFWRCGGCMLIGMGLLKARFFHGEWPRGAYAALAAACIPIGWSITGLGIVYNEINNWDPQFFWPFGEQFNYWGSIVSALGYISLGVFVAIIIAESRGIFARMLAIVGVPVRSVGRLALTNYISDTLIGTTIFYGHGYGRFGDYSRVDLAILTLKVWAIQLTLSTIYLQFFEQGPLEWVWHRLVYGRSRQRVQPIVAKPVDEGKPDHTSPG